MSIRITRRIAVVGANALLTLALSRLPEPVSAYVFLDTSSESPADKSAARDTAAPKPSEPPPAAATAAAAPVATGPKHYGNVLFLSADNMLVYAYIGVLRALDEYKVRVDLVLGESKAAAVAGSWALGYSPKEIERIFLDNPLRKFVNPFPLRRPGVDRFAPYGPDPMQVDIPLDVEEMKSPENSLTPESGEYLQLSWLVARLTHDAPGGPVADLQSTPRRMALQVTDLISGQALVLTDGELQSMLKGSMLPREVVRERPRLRHYASGSLLTGHSVLASQPYTFDRMVEVQAGPRLRPPPLEAGGDSWTDSLSQRILFGASEQGNAEAVANKTVRIELSPESWFDSKTAEPREWIEMGYTSALKSMDMILSSLGADSSARAPAPVPAAPRLDLFSGNHVVSGGNLLLLNLIDEANRQVHDSTGEESVAALMRSGYYSDLDVDWVPGIGEDAPSLVFEAKEKTKLFLRAGANVAYTQEEITDRAPELGADIVWSEPFYVPFRADAAGVLGGHQPGLRGRLVVAPVVPFPMELGLSRAHWEIDFPWAPPSLDFLDSWHVRVRRDLTRLSLRLSPRPNVYFITAGERHEMSAPSGIYVDDPGDFLSNDFEQQVFLGGGAVGPSGVRRQSLWLRGRYLNPVSLPGPVKYPFSTVESRLRLSAGDLRFLHQYYWSDQRLDDFGLYDGLQMGRIAAFTFQDEYFSMALRAPGFQNAQVEYSPVFGKAGLRLLLGGYQLYGPKLSQERADHATRAYWEIQAAYATPAGPLRAGVGGMDGEKPVLFLRFGADLGLEENPPER
jgi:hypothetical protein